MKTKNELRKLFRVERNNKIIKNVNINIEALLKTLPEFQKSKTIGYYVPFEQEINIAAFLEKSSKTIAYPYIENNQMHFLKNIRDFKVSKIGVKMPVKDNMTEIVVPDILLIPIIAINRLGFRLGYGGGYYDRYLKIHNNISIALGIETQITDFEFQDIWDQQMNYLITEKQIYTY